MAKSKSDLAERIVSRAADMASERAPWDTFWQEVGEYVMPRKGEITSKQFLPSTQKQDILFDSTAIRANMILANGQLAWMTPMESPWFSFDPPYAFKEIDAVKQYFRECSERTAVEMARSNFYSEIHELYLDRGAFGTAVIFVEPGKRGPLTFQKFDVGSFSISEDDEGMVDTLCREFELTLKQAVLKFGVENLSDAKQRAFATNDSKKLSQKSWYIHMIDPRPEDQRQQGKKDGQNKPIASVYVEKDTKHVIRDSGFDEQPFFCTRYLKWISTSAYGWCPAWMALPEARQLNFLEKQMDALAEITAFPRMLIPDTHEGEIDTRASGVTYYDANNPGAIPREWATGGRYDVGKDRAEIKRTAINNSFHVDLFSMFSQLNKQMTAREVQERSAEKLIQFSPTFARMTTELFTPMLRRVFGILVRIPGIFPTPPPELVQAGFLPEPELSYTSRIALAIKALENNSFGRAMEMTMPLLQIRPDILDNYNLDEITRDGARNDGLPARWLVSEEDRDKGRQARAQQAEQQQKAQQAQMMADAAAKAGSIKQDSVMGQALQSGQQPGGAMPGMPQ